MDLRGFSGRRENKRSVEGKWKTGRFREREAGYGKIRKKDN